MVHFTLVFTESDLLKRKVTYILLYAPALFFSIIDLTTDMISQPPTLQYWGYTPSILVGSWICHLDGIWAAALAVSSLLLFVFYYNRVPEQVRKEQAKLFSVGFGIPVALSILTDSVFPILKIPFNFNQARL
jgi:hypothetical protein